MCPSSADSCLLLHRTFYFYVFHILSLLIELFVMPMTSKARYILGRRLVLTPTVAMQPYQPVER